MRRFPRRICMAKPPALKETDRPGCHDVNTLFRVGRETSCWNVGGIERSTGLFGIPGVAATAVASKPETANSGKTPRVPNLIAIELSQYAQFITKLVARPEESRARSGDTGCRFGTAIPEESRRSSSLSTNRFTEVAIGMAAV